MKSEHDPVAYERGRRYVLRLIIAGLGLLWGLALAAFWVYFSLLAECSYDAEVYFAQAASYLFLLILTGWFGLKMYQRKKWAQGAWGVSLVLIGSILFLSGLGGLFAKKVLSIFPLLGGLGLVIVSVYSADHPLLDAYITSKRRARLDRLVDQIGKKYEQ